jgi:hypothetical protein
MLRFLRNLPNSIKGFILGSVISGTSASVISTTNTNELPSVIYHVNNASIDYYHWFNEIRKENPILFPHKIDSAGFVNVFNNISLFSHNRASSLTLQEFLCYFCTIYNETGGLFQSISERGSDAYFFENRVLNWGGYKPSYNTNIKLGNIPAGTYMYNLNIITDTIQKILWNGVIYPINADNRIKFTARNCDFYKYRGQGLIQLTGRYNFDKFVKPILPNVHYLSYLQLQHEFKKPEIYLTSMRSYLTIHPNVINKINVDEPDWNIFGHLISGKAKYHYFNDRCAYLFNRINDEGFYRIFYPEIENIELVQ